VVVLCCWRGSLLLRRAAGASTAYSSSHRDGKHWTLLKSLSGPTYYRQASSMNTMLLVREIMAAFVHGRGRRLLDITTSAEK
jgi:hypothetical protein